MNSQQRRKHRRRFSYDVTVSMKSHAGTMMIEHLGEMLEWCHLHYGKHGYSYSWDEVIRFSFPSVERAVEFKLWWADG
jgi:hypothetical protein